MVSPSNGQGYDTFIFGQYFSVMTEGSPAATQATLEVIAMIAQLSDSTAISRSNEDQVVPARRAYDAITSVEQQALVTNYSRLTDAESIIAYLKLNQGGGEETPEPGTQPSAVETFFKNNMVGLIIAAVLLVAVIGLTTWVILLKKNTKKSND